MALFHIFPAGQGKEFALCKVERIYRHRLYREDVPRRNTVALSDESVPCLECFHVASIKLQGAGRRAFAKRHGFYPTPFAA